MQTPKSIKMVIASFTTDMYRIATLQRNYDAGVAKEQLPRRDREEMDVTMCEASQEHIMNLRKFVGI